MSLLVVGLSYRTAPVSLLERVSIQSDDVPKILHELVIAGHISEVLLLSTCNRVEVYAEVDRFHGGVHDISSVLARHAGVEVPQLADHLYVHYEDAAVLHLFSVAGGLDSMVLGESQILGQLRAAYSVAAEQQAVGRSLHDLCQQALRVGKRVHSETDIDQAGPSIVTVALDEAQRVLGSLGGRRALVVGAGSMGALAAGTLRRAGVAELVVANRSPERAERLAAGLRAAAPSTVAPSTVDGLATGPLAVRTVALETLVAEVAAADVVVACTGAVGAVLPGDLVEAAVATRGGRPLVLLDLALPRDIDGAAAAMAGVTYLDLAALQAPAGELTATDDVARSREIVTAEVGSYLASQRAMAVVPTVAALRVRAAEVVQAELVRLDSRLPRLEPRVRSELVQAVHRVVQTLLHTPTVRVKELAEQPGGDSYAEALRELFGLDPSATAAMSSMPPQPLAWIPTEADIAEEQQ